MRQLKITNQITNRNSDSLEKYLYEIGKMELITPEREAELAQLIREGDKSALDQLCKANLRFVVSVAKQYQNQGLGLSDLVNEGNMGLIKAAKRFDETKGFKFISYAVWWIRQAIMQALVEQSRLVRLPLNKVGTYNKYTRMMLEMEQDLGRKPNIDEISEAMGMRPKEIKELIRYHNRTVSMDAPVGNGEDDGSFSDMIQDDGNSNPDRRLMEISLKEQISQVLSVISDREASIVSCYYGLNGEPPFTLEEIGSKFDLTRERVRQIKERALRRLRRASSSRELRNYL